MPQLILFLFTFLHPFYVSVTDINHNAKTKSLEISSKIFFDDLESDIEKENNLRIDILKSQNKELINDLIAKYLKKHIQIKVNGKISPLKYIGYEIQEEAIWCYLEASNISKVSTIEIDNHVLYNLHKEQINMLNVTVNGKRQSIKLDNPVSKAVMKF
jgi:hypothetical protein